MPIDLNNAWTVMYTQGMMTKRNIIDECHRQGWAPFLAFKEGETFIVPVFAKDDVARRFAKRNIPKDHLWGLVAPTDEEWNFIRERGWELREFSYPHRLEAALDVVIVEFHAKPNSHFVKL